MRRFAHWWLDRCFLYVGRMDEAKGVPQIVKAWLGLALELDDDCPPLWLIGGTPNEIENMRRIIGASEIEDHERQGRIRWWGYLDAAGVSTVLLKAYVLVSHSRYEPGGRVILEAMSQGIPVIATPHGFAADLIMDWHSGFLVDFDDISALRARLSHFALQPLLRHAMGPVAQRVASDALGQWRFMETHRRIYQSAAEGAAVETHETYVSPVRRKPDPCPRGFAGVYPFEGETAGPTEATAFIENISEAGEAELTELTGVSGRSRLWLAQRSGRRWVIKHSFSTYTQRPMWDRGFRGDAVELQRHRVLAEMQSSKFTGVAPILSAEPVTGMSVREWLEPCSVELQSLSRLCAALIQFHRNAVQPDLADIRAQVDFDWQNFETDEVASLLIVIQADWRTAGYLWNAWKPISLRLGWKWISIGLERSWLFLPKTMHDQTLERLAGESVIAARYEPLATFGWCHGDFDPGHFRKDQNGADVLIDCENFHPGFFGHDWAELVLYLLGDVANANETVAILTLAMEAIPPAVCHPFLLMSWLRWTTVLRACRCQALLDIEGLAKAIQLWDRLSNL